MASLAAPLLRVASSAALGSCLALSASAQSAASIEGRALDVKGAPVPNAVVRLIADPRSHAGSHPWRYTLLADSLGKFSQGGLAPGAYLVMVYSGSKAESILRTVSLLSNTRMQLDLRPSPQPERSSSPAQGSATLVSSRTFARAK